MIVCRACGHQHETLTDFCGSCGAYLEWTGEKVVEEVELLPVVPREPGAGTAHAVSPAAVPMTPAAVPEAPPPVAVPSPREEPATPTRLDPLAVEPGPVEERPLPRSRMAPIHPPPRADDRICQRCAERNPRERRLCRRCGTSLLVTATVVEPPLSGWQRVLKRRRDRRAERERTRMERRAAGGTARPPSVWRDVAELLGGRSALYLLAAVAVAVVMVVPDLRDAVLSPVTSAYTAVRRYVAPTYVAVHPISARASAELPGHEAGHTIDGLLDTFWAAPAPGPDQPPLILTVVFDHPVDLDYIGFTAAESADPKEFLAQPRPHSLHLIFSDSTVTDLELKDSRDFQAFPVEVHGVTRIEIQVVTTWAGQRGNDVGVGQVEFFKRQ